MTKGRKSVKRKLTTKFSVHKFEPLDYGRAMTVASSAQKEIPPGMIDLGIGQPTPRLLPNEAIARAAADCSRRPGRMLLAYGAEQGDAQFRTALSRFLGAVYSVPVDPAGLMVTNGASQGIDLVCTLFSQAGDTIFVEEPTYFLRCQGFIRPVLRLKERRLKRKSCAQIRREGLSQHLRAQGRLG